MADLATRPATPNPSVSPSPSPSPAPATSPTASAKTKKPAKTPAPTIGAIPPIRPYSRTGIAAGSSLSALSDTQLAARIDGMKALGIGWVRYDIEWVNIEQSPGQYNWSDYDRVVSAIASRGLQSIGVIDYTPGWARRSDCAGSFACQPANPDDYGRFAGAVANRYRSYGLHTWEIWNEPNSAQYFKPSADPAAYAAMLKSAYGAIKQADAGATIITGGLTPADTANGYMSPPDFLAGVYAAGGKGSFTAVGHHPYTFPVTVAYPNPQNAWGQLIAMHDIMAGHGDGGKLIWVTEYGAPTNGPGPTAHTNDYSIQAYQVDEALQALAVTDLFRVYPTYSWLGPLMWYSYQDAGTSTSTNENFFGLIRADGSHKPAYDAFVQGVRTLN